MRKREPERKRYDRGTADEPWYDLRPKDMAQAVHDIAQDLKNEQVWRRDRYVRNLEKFERRKLGGYGAAAYVQDFSPEDEDRLGLIRSSVCHAVADIYAPQKPKAQFQTLGASWDTRRRAYRLDRIEEGILNQRVGRWLNVWAFMHNDVCPEIALQGVGPVKITADRARERIHHRLVPHPNLLFDPAEGRDPRSLFELEPIDANQALRQFKGLKRSAIDSAKEWDWDRIGKRATRQRVTRQIEMIHAWCLPFGPDSPGVWCTTIGGEMVEHGQWDAPDFPFIFPMWEPHRDSPWAAGIADEAGDRAKEVSDLDLRYAVRARLAATKFRYYKTDTIDPADLEQNDALVNIPFSGDVPPVESMTPPFSPLELDYRNRKLDDFWDVIGMSRVSASARREPGVSSGIAIMTLNDTKSGRQLPKAKRFEDCFPLLAQQHVWRIRELAEKNRSLMLKLPGRRLMREIKWSEADVDDDAYSVTIGAASAIPHDPAGRQQWVATMFEAGLLSPETAKFMIGNPDPDAALDVDRAEEDYIDDLIAFYQNADEESFDGPRDYETPEGMIRNKPRALERFAAAWFRARQDARGLDEDERAKADFNIQLLTRYIEELDSLIKREMEFASAMQHGQPAPPGTGPMGVASGPQAPAAPPAAPAGAPPVAA